MTNHAHGGPSLFQARNNLNHRRLHNHQLPRNPHDSESNSDGGNHIRSPEENNSNNLQKRQVVVVQTVSIVHVIDESGAVIRSSTLVPDPVTQLPDSPAAATAGLTALETLLDTALPSVTAPGDVVPTLQTPAASGSALAPLSSLSGEESVTSAPYSSSSAFPTISSGFFNSTRTPSLFSNSTALYSNTTRTSAFRSKSSTSSRDPTSLISSAFVIPTDSAGGVGGNVGVEGGPAALPPAPTSTDAAPAPGSGLTPATQSAVIGGVVGGVAGIALVALALMFFLKWKRGNHSGLLLIGDGDSTLRGRGLPGPKPGGGPMTERSVPFAVPAALASLTGQKRIEDTPREPATEEKGFYRISGRKLTSVLESGGDGYSDPHDSIISGVTDYRQSEAFFGTPMQRLQLGSPMRPESGVPIMRSGPNRTPVQASGPFSDGPFGDDQRSLTPPPTNPLGRSLTSSDGSGSRGSPSKFTEGM